MAVHKIEHEANHIENIRHLIAHSDFQAAQALLDDYSNQHVQKDAEWYYRLGNLYFDAHSLKAANKAWEQSTLLSNSFENEVQSKFKLNRVLWCTAGMVIAIIFSLFVAIVILFPRQLDFRQMMLAGQSQENQGSLWDRFWSTGRPSNSRNAIEYDELWYVLSEEMRNLFDVFSEENPIYQSTDEQLIEFLNQIHDQNILNQFRTGRPISSKTDYYLLASKGFYDLKQYKEAINTLELGLQIAQSSIERARVYYEMATIYYFQGYRLQPDGLATYNLNFVRKSVDAYEKAKEHIKNPFLYGNLGWGYYLLSEYKKSIHYGVQALKISEHMNYVRMNIGIAYLRIHEYKNSFKVYEELSKFDLTTFDYAGGIRDLEELVRDYPGQYDFAYFILGHIYFTQENFKMAKDTWDIFLNSPFPNRSWKNRARQMLDTKQSNF